MYAVIKTGGKQYRVAKNQVVIVERLDGEVGGTIELGEVLMLGGDSPVVGAPLVAGAKVTATVLEQGKGEKVIIFKKKRRKNYRRRNGHRQLQTVLRIADIHAPAAQA
jgi:large subunit ribosomal protein L21